MSYQEDQINDDHLQEFQTLIGKNPQGMTFIQLFDRLPSFVEQTDLSKCIHVATQQKICAKIDGKYYPAGCVTVVPSTNAEHTTVAIRDLLSKNPETALTMGTESVEKEMQPHKVVQTEKQMTKVQPLEGEKIKLPPNGNLRRSSSTGKLAYLLWRCRGEALHRKDIKLVLADVTAGALYQSCNTLINLKMIIPSGTDAPNATYTWSGNYGYPFPNMLPMDKTLLPFNNHEEFLKWKQSKLDTNTVSKVETVNKQPNFSEVSQPTKNVVMLSSVKTSPETSIETIEQPQTKISTACELINIRILHHENELLFLKQLLSCLPDV